MKQDELKQTSARAAIAYVTDGIIGVVTNGLFAMRPADLLLLGTQEGVKVIANKHWS